MYRAVCPRGENGIPITKTINRIFLVTLKVNKILPVAITGICLIGNFDPLCYVVNQLSISHINPAILLLRLTYVLGTYSELFRLIMILLCFALMSINIGRREMYMLRSIAKKSNLVGFLFYRRFAILYSNRRIAVGWIISFLFATGFVLQVSNTYIFSCMSENLK